MRAADLEQLVVQLIERHMRGRDAERHALVTAYDPDKYLAKVKFMPEGIESGWLPIETGHIGQGYGIAIGLQPGSGGSSQWGGGGQGMLSGSQSGQQSNDQSLGDQVIVRYQEGDMESAKIVQRVHSDQDKPPGKVNSGEMVMWTKFKKDQNSGPDAQQTGGGGQGCKMYFKNDGSLTITDGNGATLAFDGKGNVTWNAKKNTETYSDTVNISTQKDMTVTAKTNMNVTASQQLDLEGTQSLSLDGASIESQVPITLGD